MIINMLEAVSEMLDVEVSLVTASTAKVKCAKIMLDKIIEGMKDKPTMIGHGRTPAEAQANMHVVEPSIEVKLTNPEVAKDLAEKRKAKENEVEIEVDAGIIKSIKNAKDDTMIQLDGKAYPWRNAIGMSFTEGKVL